MAETVKRYRKCGACLQECQDGTLVMYHDYAALQANARRIYEYLLVEKRKLQAQLQQAETEREEQEKLKPYEVLARGDTQEEMMARLRILCPEHESLEEELRILREEKKKG